MSIDNHALVSYEVGPEELQRLDRALDLAERWVANEERREDRLAAAQHESGKRKGAAARAETTKDPTKFEPGVVLHQQTEAEGILCADGIMRTPEAHELFLKKEAARADFERLADLEQA